ncbi:nuclear speckle splicing regulatory protein 1-like, partial [Frankliniella occidentalis]|uniref:Nuclear speckle splicing regulatory protein 1-like n=1 Tax=Frankliniella occidentalis TaxID=133901 RepID=A0A9C6XBC3_FRAOC
MLQVLFSSSSSPDVSPVRNRPTAKAVIDDSSDEASDASAPTGPSASSAAPRVPPLEGLATRLPTSLANRAPLSNSSRSRSNSPSNDLEWERQCSPFRQERQEGHRERGRDTTTTKELHQSVKRKNEDDRARALKKHLGDKTSKENKPAESTASRDKHGLAAVASKRRRSSDSSSSSSRRTLEECGKSHKSSKSSGDRDKYSKSSDKSSKSSGDRSSKSGRDKSSKSGRDKSSKSSRDMPSKSSEDRPSKSTEDRPSKSTEDRPSKSTEDRPSK